MLRASPMASDTTRRIKPASSVIAMLGVPFDNVTTAETADVVERMISSGHAHYIATANVDFLVQARQDIELRRILFDADLVVCDGMPLVWASRLLGNPLKERVAGSDLVPLLIRIAEEKGYRVFFLGGKEEVIEKAVDRVLADHPKLQIAGSYSPPFAPLLEMDHDDICRRVNESKPDMCFVSFGCPKQEKWIRMNRAKIDVPMSVGVGATIDFLAGSVNRAPRWVGKCGLEWIYRLCQEPRRLFKRYAIGLWVFGFAILWQMWRMKFRPRPKPSATKVEVTIRSGPDHAYLQLPESLDRDSIGENVERMDEAIRAGKPIIICQANCTFVDSTGSGFLTRLAKEATESQAILIMVDVSPEVKEALEMMSLQKLIRIAGNREEGLALGRGLLLDKDVVKRSDAGGDSVVSWSGELTAANVRTVWTELEPVLNDVAKDQELLIEIADLRFIDSSGAGLMVKVKKESIRRDIELRFNGATDEVMNVLQLTRLREFLLGSSK